MTVHTNSVKHELRNIRTVTSGVLQLLGSDDEKNLACLLEKMKFVDERLAEVIDKLDKNEMHL